MGAEQCCESFSFYFNLSGAWRKCFRFNVIILLVSSLYFFKWR